MKRLDAGQTIAMIANVGVLVGLMVLIVEVRLANRIATASTEIEVRGNFAEISASLSEDEALAKLMVAAMEPEAEFTAVERLRLASVVRRFNNAWLSVETAYENGMVPAATFEMTRNDIRGVLASFPGARPLWRNAVEGYPAQRDSRTYEAIYAALEDFDGPAPAPAPAPASGRSAAADE